MAYCTNCGQKLAEGAKFCANCGKEVEESNASTQRKTVFDGELHKCPNCGELLESFVAKCPSCGYELRGSGSVSSVRTLAMKLEQLESKRPPKKIGNVFSTALAGGQLSSIDEQKVDLIRNFSIPNTKEDVREFIILASSNIDMKLYGMTYHSSQIQGMTAASQKAVSDAWLAKFEQAYQKAKLLFGETQEFVNIQLLYESKMKEIAKKKRQFPLFIIALVGGILFLLVFIWLLVFLTNSI